MGNKQVLLGIGSLSDGGVMFWVSVISEGEAKSRSHPVAVVGQVTGLL